MLSSTSSSSSHGSTRFPLPHPYRSPRLRQLRPAVLAMDDSHDLPAAPSRSVAVVGAGISGLAAAYKLRKSGVRVTVFEAADRAGGKIRSNSESGFLWDEGANTMTESELETSRLIDDLGLQDRQQYPNSQHKRYIVKDGAPALIPSDPIALMKSTVLSTKSKFKLFLEPFLYEKSSRRNSGKVFDEHLSERKKEYIDCVMVIKLTRVAREAPIGGGDSTCAGKLGDWSTSRRLARRPGGGKSGDMGGGTWGPTVRGSAQEIRGSEGGRAVGGSRVTRKQLQIEGVGGSLTPDPAAAAAAALGDSSHRATGLRRHHPLPSSEARSSFRCPRPSSRLHPRRGRGAPNLEA